MKNIVPVQQCARTATRAIAAGCLLAAVVAAAAAQEIDRDHWAYSAIATEPDAGNRHVDGAVDYGTSFPTSGPHSPQPAAPGFYVGELNSENLIHALEHGNVVVYYDTPGEGALQWIRRWTDAYQGALDGVIAVRKEGLEERVVLTAWQERLELDGLDSRGAYFVDAFRGRGPEQRVR